MLRLVLSLLKTAHGSIPRIHKPAAIPASNQPSRAHACDIGAGGVADVPGRVRQEVAAHPLKWAMVAIVGGVVASRVLPVALRLVQTAASRRLVGTVVATLAPLAVRAGVNALAARRPDLLEAFVGGAAPASAQPPPSSSFGG